MKANRKLIVTLLAGVLAVASAGVLAHGPGSGTGPGMGPMGGRGGMNMPEAATSRMDHLRGELKLTPQQVAAFDAFADKVKSEAQVRTQMRDAMRQQNLDGQARSAHRVTMAKHNAEAAEQLHALRSRLYEALTPEQRQTLDRHGPGMQGGPRFGAGPGFGGGPGHRGGFGHGGGNAGGCRQAA